MDINNRAVKIYGKRFGVPPDANATYRLAEIQYGTFERILYLPVPIDSNKVSASFANGFLTIRLSKIALDKTHKITIKDG